MSEENKNSAPGPQRLSSDSNDHKETVSTTNPATTAQPTGRALSRSPKVTDFPASRSSPSYLTDLFANKPASPTSSLSPAISAADTEMVENWPQDHSNDGPS